MSTYHHEIDVKDLPFDLSDCQEAFGRVELARIECPGVYYLYIGPVPGRCAGHGVYAVTDSAPVSQDARAYGKALPGYPDVLLYPVEGENFAYKIIEYEIKKFYVKNGLPTDPSDSLHAMALYGAEVCPEYFGFYSAPAVTPWGYTTRYKTIDPGVFWIETDQCVAGLAVSYVKKDDLSEYVSRHVCLTGFDRAYGIDETMGYLFFEEAYMCLVLFELMDFSPKSSWDTVDTPALMNAIWRDFPDYAASYNLAEQRGEHDILGNLLWCFDPDQEAKGSVKNMITLSENAGFDFLRIG